MQLVLVQSTEPVAIGITKEPLLALLLSLPQQKSQQWVSIQIGFTHDDALRGMELFILVGVKQCGQRLAMGAGDIEDNAQMHTT